MKNTIEMQKEIYDILSNTDDSVYVVSSLFNNTYSPLINEKQGSVIAPCHNMNRDDFNSFICYELTDKRIRSRYALALNDIFNKINVNKKDHIVSHIYLDLDQNNISDLTQDFIDACKDYDCKIKVNF